MQTETTSATAQGLTKFQELCREAWEQRIEVDRVSHIQKIEAAKLEDLKAKVLAYMEEAGVEKQHVAGFGTLSILNRFSVKVPQGDGKLAFFDYLKDKGIFEDMATVHSQTLNSWYQAEMDKAIAEGNMDFKVAGIEEPKIAKTLGFRKG